MKKGFLFGAASSAYQIEGAYNEDGKGPSIWDIYVQKEGLVFGGETGNIACDHYHRMKEDVALMKEIGLKAYRFSVAWSRILPEGTGRINPEGIAFYNRLIDELIACGIEPYLTLFHWDLPQALFEKGGMSNREFADWFAEYAKVIVENFSDRVKYYMTINEPQCIVGGYQGENRAPGYNLALAEAIPLIHNMLLAHGKAVDSMRKYAKQEIKISFASTGFVCIPDTESKEDIDCAKKATFAAIYPHMWWTSVPLYSDPIMFGSYPSEVIEIYGKYLPEGWEADMPQICRPVDYYCFNYYQAGRISAEKGFIKHPQGGKVNSAHWPVTPEGIYWGTKFIYERYKKPVYISENGYSGNDWISDDGRVHDPYRIDFVRWHLKQLERAQRDGVDVHGYFYWSIMDNMEWGDGYKERFGLIFVDYETQKRTIKDSGYWYKNLIEETSRGE